MDLNDHDGFDYNFIDNSEALEEEHEEEARNFYDDKALKKVVRLYSTDLDNTSSGDSK